MQLSRQRFFREGHEGYVSKDNRLMYGRSVSNQRIEASWSILRKMNTDFWIDYFVGPYLGFFVLAGGKGGGGGGQTTHTPHMRPSVYRQGFLLDVLFSHPTPKVASKAF